MDKERIQIYTIFLLKVLKATAHSNGDPKIIYPLLEANLDKLDHNFANILRNWATAKFSEIETDAAEFIANTIGNFSNCLRDFPLGNKANNMKIVIAGYEAVLKVFTRESNPENWAMAQNNLGTAYLYRIRGDKADNLENAIAAFLLVLSVCTKKDFPMDWAMTQNNLGTAYYERIRGDKAENLENAIAAYLLALSVRTKEDFPMDWAGTQNNLGNAYLYRIRGDKAQNLESAIAAYLLALSVRTKEDFPMDWAMTQNNLAAAYYERIRGDKAENLENAIAAYLLALEVRTKKDFPMDWAATQNNLSTAYYERIRGDKAENLENAIAAYLLALSVYTKEDFPYYWALTQNNLGNAYCDRIKEDKAQNLENAIAAYLLALEVRTKKDFPYEWAKTQNNLGNAYCDRIKGDKAQNLEKAIAAFLLALSAHTKEDLPYYWATTQSNLAIAYSNRIRGDKAQNLENAIAAYHLALSVRTKKDFPYEWAKTQNNLATAYSKRIRGDKAQNLENAITASLLALEVRTKEDFPMKWAQTQNNLGTAYYERIRGDKAENLENAIAAYHLALSVRTKEDFPMDWAQTQNNLATAYRYRIKGDKAENLEKAIAAYLLALSVYTSEADPFECLRTSKNLGNLHFKEGNWQRAIAAYEKTITAVELSRSWSKDDDRRQEILESSIVVYHNIIQSFVNLQQYDKAIEYAERSRSRMVAELMASKDLYPNAEIPQHLLEEYYRLQQLLSNLHRSNSVETFHGTSLPSTESRFERRDSGEVEKQRLAEIEKIEAKRQKVWREIRSSDPVLAGQLQVDSMSIQQIQALIKDQETAILNFYTTKNDTYIFIVRQQDIQLYSCRGEGIETFQNWVGQNWLRLYIENKAEWHNNMGEFLQQLAQRLQLDRLIAQHLTDIKELIIVPHIFLHQIPFAALPITTETVTIADNLPMDNTKGMKFNPRPPQTQTTTISKTYLSDKFRLRVVPSCQILSYCDNHNKTTNSAKMGIVENATNDLKGSEYECQNLAQMFQVPNNLHLKYQQATVNNYRQLAKQVQILHSSHHASADLINPLESKLKLFDGDVTLGDVFTWRLPELTDVFLSCCETNLTFINKLNDDILTIAAGFLSAGAQSVVSTLWAVDDFATALFCLFYYENRQNPKYTRPEALHKAQIDLRNLTGKQLNDRYRQQLEKHLEDIKTEENQEQIGEMRFRLERLCNEEYPFNSPYYWAAFVSQGLQ